jgi:hypothetical protein
MNSIAMDAFGGFLSKTENTQQISDLIARYSKTKVDALRLVSQTAFKYNKYKSDLENYGVMEKFAKPDETLSKGSGDCDCKAGLIDATLDGLPPDLKPNEHRVTVGKYLGKFPPDPYEYHAWVEARIGDTWYVLDGTSGKVYQKPDIRYVSMFNIYPDKITMNNPTIDLLLGIPLVPILSFATAVENIEVN